jgi:hypothetical protein
MEEGEGKHRKALQRRTYQPSGSTLLIQQSVWTLNFFLNFRSIEMTQKKGIVKRTQSPSITPWFWGKSCRVERGRERQL